jgi:sulfur-carrier protein adenylyltransferase/sulfurtransferase
MDLKKLFTPVSSMDADEAKAYMAGHREDDYTVLDVRQPGEYEDEHLPGARLIPLPQLSEAYSSLDPEKPVIVHCAVGGRSRVAAQMLSGHGFKEVYNLAGGIKAFKGPKAAGPQELNLDLVRGDETPAEIIALAYGMERALQLFYEAMLGRTGDQEMQDLFSSLARVEQRHQQRLLEQYRGMEPGPDPGALEAAPAPEILEGGFKMQEFMEKNESFMQTVPHVLDLAMMLETQALDLYLRFVGRCSQAATREVLFGIAAEEKAHLASLGRLLEAKLTERG